MLKGGFAVEVPRTTVQYLLSDECYLCEKIGSKFEFEIQVGMNNRVWMNTKDFKNLLTL